MIQSVLLLNAALYLLIRRNCIKIQFLIQLIRKVTKTKKYYVHMLIIFNIHFLVK